MKNKTIFAVSILVAILAVLVFVFLVKNPSKLKGPELPAQNSTSTLGLIEEADPGAGNIEAYAKAKLYFINLNAFQSKPDAVSEGAIGCGDGLIAQTIPVSELDATSRGDFVHFLLTKLQDPKSLADAKAKFISSPADIVLVGSGKHDNAQSPEFYSVLSKANLSMVTLKDMPGAYEVRLKGTLSLGGVCDEPRATAQLKRTIESAFEPSTVKIFLNNKQL